MLMTTWYDNINDFEKYNIYIIDNYRINIAIIMITIIKLWDKIHYCTVYLLITQGSDKIFSIDAFRIQEYVLCVPLACILFGYASKFFIFRAYNRSNVISGINIALYISDNQFGLTKMLHL